MDSDEAPWPPKTPPPDFSDMMEAYPEIFQYDVTQQPSPPIEIYQYNSFQQSSPPPPTPPIEIYQYNSFQQLSPPSYLPGRPGRRVGRPSRYSPATSTRQIPVIQKPSPSGGVSWNPPSSGGVSRTPPSYGGVSRTPPSYGGVSRIPPSSGGVSRIPPTSGGVSRIPPTSGGVSRIPPPSGGVSPTLQSAGRVSRTRRVRRTPQSAGRVSRRWVRRTPSPSGEVSGETPQRRRGRPLGSGTKNEDEKEEGADFKIHIITVEAGQDVCSAIEAFTLQGQCRVLVIEASGVVSYVSLSHHGTDGASIYTGLFNIITLTSSIGEYGLCGFTMSISGENNEVYGGEVCGLVTAASPVQVVLGTYVDEEAPPSNVVGSSTGEAEAESEAEAEADAESPPLSPSKLLDLLSSTDLEDLIQSSLDFGLD